MFYLCGMSTKEKIVERALQLFNESGINKVGVREIAASLGISPGNMSYYFPKKEDLLEELQGRIVQANDAAFKSFFNNPGGIVQFLQLMQQIFNNQYKYRCLLLSLVELQRERDTNRVTYREIEQRRRNFYRNVFQTMVQYKELRATEADLDFLVSFITLAGRFWLSEAAVSFRDWTKEEIINYYLKLITKQLALFATTKGKAILANVAWAALEKESTK